MAKKNLSPAVVATAIFVIATIKTRCRAGYVFNNETETRIALDDLTPEQLASIEADPYLKVTWEGDEDPNAVNAEAHILELETQLAEATKQVAQLTSDLAVKDKELTGLIEQLEAKDEELKALNDELVALQVAADDKATTKKK